MNRRITYQTIVLLTALCLSGSMVYGQRITFGTWAGSNITIQAVSVNTLNFGNVVKGVVTPKIIDIAGATGFAVTAPDGYDLTVTVDAPTVLDGPEGKTIPFGLRFAYSNQGLLESQARLSTTEVPLGFNSVSFPVKRNAMGLPAPPPDPLDATNNTRIKATAYLYFYGSAGPAGNDAVAGLYTGTVTITVEYTSN